MTKKAAALLLAASLAVSVCATPVFAAGTPPVQNEDHVQGTGAHITDPTLGTKACMQLKYNVTEGYNWSIPADIDFGEDNTTHGQALTSRANVAVKDCTLRNGYTLNISINGNGGQYNTDAGDFMIKTADGAELEYGVRIDKGNFLNDPVLTPNSNILSIAAGVDHEETNLLFSLETEIDDEDNAAETAGEYIGYAIFTAQATK